MIIPSNVNVTNGITTEEVRHEEYSMTYFTKRLFWLTSIHWIQTYIISVETMSDCSDHIELSVFLMEAKHVRQMIRVIPQRPESREDRASFLSSRHIAHVFSPVHSLNFTDFAQNSSKCYHRSPHISVSKPEAVKLCYIKNGSSGNPIQWVPTHKVNH